MSSYKLYDTPEWEKRIREACANNDTMLSACTSLGISYTSFKRYSEKFGCWKPNQSRKGLTRSDSEYSMANKVDLNEILLGLHPFYPYSHLKRRLLRAGILKNECEECNLTEWRGKKLTMQMHHVDGDNRNHNRENLRMLCPNCHAQTPSYSGSKKGRMAE